jgi:two-component system chemotaxis response regulator CheY
MTPTMPWQGKTVLVVDDAPLVRIQIQELCIAQGLHVVGQAENGLEALERYELLHPDLVLLDILMGEMDGVECYLRLQKKHPGCAVIFVSALPQASLMNHRLPSALPEGLFIRKPMTEAHLQQALQVLYLTSPTSELPNPLTLLPS